MRVLFLDSHFDPKKLQIFFLLLLQSGLPDLSQVTEANCYYGLGVALLKFESAVCQMEASIEAGQKVPTLKPLLSLQCCFSSSRSSPFPIE
jgi:hypothetical protein